MNRGIYGFPVGPPLPPEQNRAAKLLDLNMAGLTPASASATRFEFMLPPGLVFLDAVFREFRLGAVVNVYAGLVNNAGTSAPMVTHTIDGVTGFTVFGGAVRYTVAGRVTTAVGVMMCSSTASAAQTGTALATTAPPADRFRFYTDGGRITQGQLILYGTF